MFFKIFLSLKKYFQKLYGVKEDMAIDVIRFKHHQDYTVGELYVDDEYQCLTIEDEYRTVKKWGETRIPDGIYEIKLRKEGGFHQRYLKRFGPKFHKGMLHIQNVPNFKWVLIHIGNSDDDTAGCLLTCTTFDYEKEFGHGSEKAYRKMYPKVANHLESGGRVFLNIISHNFNEKA